MLHFINKQSKEHVEYVKQNLEEKLNNINTIEVCGEMIKTYAANNNVKSTDDFYKVCNAASPLLNKAKATKSQVRKSIGSSNYKASDILAGTVQRKVKKRKYTGEDQDRVKVFYERSDISRINPCQKRKKLEKCLHYMKMTFRNAHEIYNKEYPEAMVDFNFFKRSKPGHIRTLAATPLNICSCVYCTNVDEKLKVLGIPGIKTARDLYKELICKKSKSFRNKECIFHTCKECEDWSGKIKSLASSLDMKKKIAYRRWEYIGYEQKHSGKTVPKRTNIPKLKTTEECLEELIKKDILKPQKNQKYTFVKHFFIQSYQFQMYKNCEKSLERNECICIQDYAQNLEISYYSEIKASKWAKKQITVHVQVLMYKTSESDTIKRLTITHVSEDLKHDTPMVHYMTLDTIAILSKRHPNEVWKKIYVWSDGCGSQYKSKSSFYFLDQYPVPIERNFYGSEHGKNMCDAFTGKISTQYSNAVKSDDKFISNASEMKEFLCEAFHSDKRKIFKLIEKDDENLKDIRQAFNNEEIKVLEGKCTATLHQIKYGNEKGYRLVRNFSCFCSSCRDNDFENCENETFTGGEYESKRLELKSDVNIEKVSPNATEEENEEYIDVVDTIIVQKQEIQFKDLAVGDLIVVPVEGRHKKVLIIQLRSLIWMRMKQFILII